jgi:hypothetical protein
MNKIIFSHKIEDYKLSSIKDGVKDYLSNKKITMGMIDSNDSKNKQKKGVLNPIKFTRLDKNNIPVDRNSNIKNNNSTTSTTRVIRRTNGT